MLRAAEAYFVVKVLGAAYLAWLGVRALWRSRRDAPGAPGRTQGGRGPYVSGLVTNVLNPKIAVFHTGLLPTPAPDGLSTAAGMGLLVLLHAALTLGWLGGYAWLVTRARSVFERPRVRRALDRVTGVVLIGFGLRVATEAG
ncbi:LysE family transporter [Streptomyces caatingaensis]|uniref:LysE family transporter n=1 Tax=Streptomyces caatingaensis TaxID=1678637 RepID=UPI00099CC3BA